MSRFYLFNIISQQPFGIPKCFGRVDRSQLFNTRGVGSTLHETTLFLHFSHELYCVWHTASFGSGMKTASAKKKSGPDSGPSLSFPHPALPPPRPWVLLVSAPPLPPCRSSGQEQPQQCWALAAVTVAARAAFKDDSGSSSGRSEETASTSSWVHVAVSISLPLGVKYGPS